MTGDTSEAPTLVRGDLYEWEWPPIGAGAMARMRGLAPYGRAVTREDVPHMREDVQTIGLQALLDKSWIIPAEWVVANGCRLWKLPHDWTPAYGPRSDGSTPPAAL